MSTAYKVEQLISNFGTDIDPQMSHILQDAPSKIARKTLSYTERYLARSTKWCRPYWYASTTNLNIVSMITL